MLRTFPPNSLNHFPDLTALYFPDYKPSQVGVKITADRWHYFARFVFFQFIFSIVYMVTFWSIIRTASHWWKLKHKSNESQRRNEQFPSLKKKNSNNWMSQQVSLARKVREVALKIDETFTKAQYMAVAGSTRWAFGHSEHVEPIERAPIIMTIPNDLSRFAAFELRGFSSVPQLSEKCCEAPRNFYIAPDFNPN